MEEWFLKMFNMYIDDIFRLAYSYTQNKEDADDITQNVFIKYYKNINKIELDEKSVKKWLITVTINNCKDFLKSAWRKYTTHISEENENKILRYVEPDFEQLHNSLNRLPAKNRLILHLYYFLGYDTKEIAQLVKIKESTIRQQLSRARKKLKEEMEVSDE
jgi:RNA polymerase sigma-70 factor (ECF subfamily)